MNMLKRHRGVALITVLILLSLCLFFVTALLIRSNNTIFMVDFQQRATQARYIAESAALQRGVLMRQSFEKFNNTASVAVNAALPTGTDIMTCSAYTCTINDAPVYSATSTNTPIGYADVSIQYTTPAGSTTDSCVTITSEGSTVPRSTTGQLTRTVKLTYHLDTVTSPVFNFAYFMNHWAWFSGYSQSQCQIFGNTGANANFDVLSGTLSVNNANMPAVNVFGTLYNNNSNPSANNNSPFSALNVRANISGVQTASGFGNIAGSVNPVAGLGRMPTLTNLADIANESGTTITSAKTQAQQGNSVLQMRTYEVTSTNPFTLSSTYVVKQTYTTTGVYGATGSGQKENLVLAGTPVNQMVAGYNKNIDASGKPTVDVVSVTGPVVVKGNVVLQGLVEGRGTLFAGRNLYLAGNVQYKGNAGPSMAPAYDYPTNGQAGNSTTTSPTPLPVPSQSDCATASMVSYVAGGNVIYGDVTNSVWQSSVMNWLDYVDPNTHQHVNDNHEDSGMDGIVNSQQFHPTDVKENDGKWTVQVIDSSGNKIWKDFPIYNNAVDTSGYTVVPGTGEDTDGNGRYTPPFNYTRDLSFADRSGNAQSFSSSTFDGMPTNTGSSSTNYNSSYNGTYGTFCTPVNRIDGYVISNNSISGYLGDNAHNIVTFGGQIGRQECMITNIGSAKQLLYQDPRITQTAVPVSDVTSSFPPQHIVKDTLWQEL